MWVFLLVGVVVAGLACEDEILTATPAPTSAPTTAPLPTSLPTTTPTPTLTPTATPTPAPTASPTPTISRASQVLQTAIENLRAQASFRVLAVIENAAVTTTINAEIAPPDKGYVHESWATGIGTNADEFLFVDGLPYSRPPGFQVWFDYSGTTWARRTSQDFPYDLGLLAEETGDLEVQSADSIDGPVYRVTGTGTRRLDEALGFDVGARSRDEATEIEIWISRDDLLPLRIEARFDKNGEYFNADYSGFGSAVDISAPESVLDLYYLQGLLDGTLGSEEKGLVVRAFPAEGQKCVENEIGAAPYQELVSGTSDLDSVLLWVLDHCEEPIFSYSDLFARSGIAEALYSLDLTVLTIPRGDMTGDLAECVRESVGLEALFEVGWGERPPTVEEVTAGEMCRMLAGEGGNP